ncbi:MAG: phenylalanine--tRNA ligase subunit beta [Nanoarchaeota archaeon]|nr:phenylalanine--tRNA ligase subunit beta [Nanoarchaeota archaeon]
MPSVSLDKKTVLKMIGKKLGDSELAERLPMHGLFLEGITEDKINVEIFPNRPDMLSEEGFARAFAGFLGVKTGLEKFAVRKSDYAVTVDAKIAKIDRKYIGIAVMKGLKFDDEFIISSMQLQDKLATTQGRRRKKVAMGVYDLDKIRFPLAYTTVSGDEKFVPMEHDSEMKISELAEGHKRGKEYAHLIKGMKEFPAYRDADGKILCVIPITQADFTKVTEKTKDVMIEVTGTDWRAVQQILNILVTNWSSRGAELCEAKIKYPFETPEGRAVACPILKTARMEFDVNYANRLLGLDLTAEQAAKLLERMRYGAAARKDKVKVDVPAYRTDVLHQFDLVEDIAIAYGYENFRHEIPQVSAIGEETARTFVSRKIAEVCSGLGLLECCTLHLSNERILNGNMLLKNKNIVKTINAVNIEYDMVRNSLLPMLLKTLSENTHHEYPQKLFEIGEVYEKENNEPVERNNLSMVSCHSRAEFTEMKSLIEALFSSIGEKVSFREAKRNSFISSRCAAVLADGKQIGIMGEIHPQALANFKLEMPAAGFECNIDWLVGKYGK